MRLYRKLPGDERRKGKDSEYIFEHRTKRSIRHLCAQAHEANAAAFSRLTTVPAPVIVLEYHQKCFRLCLARRLERIIFCVLEEVGCVSSR